MENWIKEIAELFLSIVLSVGIVALALKFICFLEKNTELIVYKKNKGLPR